MPLVLYFHHLSSRFVTILRVFQYLPVVKLWVNVLIIKV